MKQPANNTPPTERAIRERHERFPINSVRPACFAKDRRVSRRRHKVKGINKKVEEKQRHIVNSLQFTGSPIEPLVPHPGQLGEPPNNADCKRRIPTGSDYNNE
jgi:hypothetical protein